MLTQIPGGWLATRFGGKHVYGVGIVMTSVLTLVTPISADFSVWMLVAVRVLEGLFEVSLLHGHVTMLECNNYASKNAADQACVLSHTILRVVFT